MLKLKKQYINSATIGYFKHGKPIIYYPCIRSYMNKCFSTKQEKSAYYIHMIEYKHFNLKIRACRGRNIANPRDDYTSYVYKMSKSWKYKSKRKRQYHN
ncbi:hypothetical protein A9G08_00390 [Gilliamella sp. wkB195]|nr:hypothetical protein A9G08_00390 [Gilliamella apicola]